MSDIFQRALALIKIDQLFEALPLLNQVIESQPERTEAYQQRAKIRRRLGDKEGAIADYTKAIRLAPSAETYLARALVWLSLAQAQGAIADSREAIKIKPELAGGHRLLGKALGLSGDGVGAIAAYKQAARCYLADKDKENAQACLDAIGPLRALPPFDYAQGSGGAGVEIGRAVTPEVFMGRVRANYEAGEYAQAMRDLNWFLDFQPTHGQALCLRGLIQAQLGRREQAVADLALAREHHPDDIEVRFCRGQMRLILKDGYGAIEEFSALIEAAGQAGKPEARFFAQRGHGYRAIEEPEKALKDYANATAIDTENAELYELRAEMQQAMGGTEGAIADYQQAATLWLNQGNWQKHQTVVEAVRRLRKQPKASPNSKSAVVAIKSYERHMPVVEVLLDGIAKFDMVIDRNASHSIVTQQMANQLNLEIVSYRYVYLADGTPMELSIGRLRSVVIGPVIVTDVYVAIAPDKSTALLGKDCFSAYSVRISGNEITFIHH